MNFTSFNPIITQYKRILGLLLCTALIFSISHLSFAQGSAPEKKDDTILQTIDGNLPAMVGQMLLFGFRGTELSQDPNIITALQEGKIGGVILSPRQHYSL